MNETLRIRCLTAFSDYTIFDRRIKQGEELSVTDNEYARAVQSGGKFQIIGRIIPPPTKAVEEVAEPEPVVTPKAKKAKLNGKA